MISHNPGAAIIERLDRDAVTSRLLEAFRTEIPGYHRLPNQVLEERIRGIARHNLDLCFDTIIRGTTLDRRDLEPFRASARDRASEGMGLEDLLHAYRLGGRIGWHAIREAALPAERLSLPDVAEAVMGYIDEVSTAVAQAYLDERQQLVSEEERIVRDLFEALLQDREIDSRLIGLASRRGFVIAPTYHAFVVRVGSRGGRRHADLAAAMRREGTLALTEGDRVAGLVAPAQRARLSTVQGLVIVSEEVARGSLAEAIEEVRAVSELAEARAMNGEVDLSRFSLELLLLASPRNAQRLADSVLAPLGLGEDGRRSELLVTLEAFVAENFDRRRTAERLHVHPNTLDYRLRRVRELTGLDLRSADAIAILVLAVKQANL